MYKRLFVIFIYVLFSETMFAQSQTCPANINFGDNTLTNWGAYVGQFNGSQLSKTLNQYPSTSNSPLGTIGVASINEYYGQGGNGVIVPGIYINSVNSTDYFGGFPTIPNINGYQYATSITLGSTTIWGSSQKGLVRGVSYIISVPPGSATDPYTMTYAYAMVLENGSHTNDQQPLSRATLTKPDGTVVNCASPSYYLPTYRSGNAYVLDQAAAIQQGFSKSSRPSPNPAQGEDPLRVWYKPWTEVTFDLSAYRGQQVTLTFEADNCVPGGHFSYAYFAIRNECNGLQITGPQIACTNTSATYTIPALPGSSTFNWVYPPNWTAKDSANFLYVTPNNQSGTIQVTQSNSCDTVTSTLNVDVKAPTIAGSVVGSDTVCTGANSTVLSVTGNAGNILNWLSSTDGISWNPITDTLPTYTADNLTQTTQYRAIVQNGNVCAIDTSGSAIIDVSPLSIGGNITPNPLSLCSSQDKDNIFKLTGNTGDVLNWQFSYDSTNWTNFSSVNNTSSQAAITFSTPTQYRVIVKSGACPTDTSNMATTTIYNDLYPNATISPSDTSICYGDSATLNVNITTASSYNWINSVNLADLNNGNIPPYNFNAIAKPLQNYSYVIGFTNLGCPNILLDTAVVNVYPRIKVNAGNDTVIVVNQPLQLNATANVTEPLNYSWIPSAGLDNPFIYNPVATLQGLEGDTVVYTVTARDSVGCFGTDALKVVIFKTLPDIFVPTAFTPNNDGTNDILKAIPVGIKTFEYFNIYNRYGQLLFTTPDPERGWDGNLNGYKQPSGTYVYMARGISYQNRIVFRKGTVVLIR